MSSAVINAKVQTQEQELAHEHEHDHDDGSKTIFGFWIYILTDCILFATLFATYAVLSPNTFGGPTGKDIFVMPFVLVETFILLTSSFTYGLAMLAMHKNNVKQVVTWLGVTFVLGFAFIVMEVYEFHELVEEGYSWQVSAFLSSFFVLVGTHGLHVTLGLVWMAIMIYLVSKRGLDSRTRTRLTCLSLFWHFLDVIWICVFTVVYLMGVI